MVVTKEDMTGNAGVALSISKCLPEFKPSSLQPSDILSKAQMHVLTYHLPSICRMHQWKLLFSINEHGYSPFTFFKNLGGTEYTMLVIET